MKAINFLHDLTRTIDKYTLNFDCFSYGQLTSKQWLIDELKALGKTDLGIVFNLCGWYGLLPAMMFHEGFQSRPYDKIRSFDKDEKCWQIADKMNKTHIQNKWKFKAVTEDINNINFQEHKWIGWSNVATDWIEITERPDTVINTSCEHTSDEWFMKINSSKLIIIQSNNYWNGKGHVNCCFDIDDFDRRYAMKDVLYIGQRALEKYTRFMKIGYR